MLSGVVLEAMHLHLGGLEVLVRKRYLVGIERDWAQGPIVGIAGRMLRVSMSGRKIGLPSCLSLYSLTQQFLPWT